MDDQMSESDFLPIFSNRGKRLTDKAKGAMLAIGSEI